MNEKELYVVALGASAGGNDAILRFFKHLSVPAGMAFIVIRHISRNHKSYFSNMLKSITSLNIIEVKEEFQLQPDTIYLMPENKKLLLKGNILFPVERPAGEKINYSINEFFCSMSEQLRERAIGVVLSGYMDDGTKGAKCVEAKGGLVLVQDPDSAEKNQMPLAVITQDHPDYILRPEDMPAVIMNYLSNRKMSLPRSTH